MSNIQRGLMFLELILSAPRISTLELSKARYKLILRGLQFG
jgi:hypothetical protein